MNIENTWAEIWNPQVPIEAYFKQLEDIFEQALANPPAYTQEQVIGKAITSMEQCGLFPTALLEWNGFDPQNKDWANLRHILERPISYSLPLDQPEGSCCRESSRTRTASQFKGATKTISP